MLEGNSYDEIKNKSLRVSSIFFEQDQDEQNK